jgi:hypothetical protein
VVELCRLCGAALELSVENPRRVCGACGEVNLPNDGGGAALPVGQIAPMRLSKFDFGKAPSQLLVGAAAPLGTMIVAAIVGTISGVLQRGSVQWAYDGIVFLPLALMGSFLFLVIHVMKHSRALAAGLFWLVGVVLGIGLSWALSLGWAIASWLFKH